MNKKTILIEDDCAPDALIYFERDFKKETGFSIKEFVKLSEIKSDVDEIIWKHGNYELSNRGDHQFYILEKYFKPLRYTLRNKKKIINHFDAKTFDRITDSLDKHFKKAETIEIKEAEPYQLIGINDLEHTCGLIIFHVISIHYDVYNLAFKEFMG